MNTSTMIPGGISGDVSSSLGRDSRSFERGFFSMTSQTHVGGTGSIVSGTSNGDGSDSVSEYTNTSLIASFEEKVSTLILGLQQHSGLRETNWWNFFFTLLYHFIAMWTMLFLPSIDERGTNWDVNGKWVWRAANYFVTLSLSISSIDAIEGILIGFFVVISACIIMLIASYQAIQSTSKYWNRIKIATRVILGFLLLFSMVYSYVYSLILSCDYGNKVQLVVNEQSVEVLRDFRQVACTSAMNSTLLAVGGLFFVILMVLNILASITLFDNNPTCKNWFCAETNFVFTPIIPLNSVFIILMGVLPNQSSLAFILPIIYIVFSTGYICYFLYLLPFFRRMENSIFVGFHFARLGSAVGYLISSIVNNISGVRDDVKLGMLGVVFGLAIIFFIVSFFGCEIYLRVACSSIRKILTESELSKDDKIGSVAVNIERDATFLYQIIESQGKLRQLKLFFRFSKSYRKYIGEDLYSDMDTCLKFIKGLFSQRTTSKMPFGVSLSSSVIVAYYNPIIVLSISVSTTMLKRAQKQVDHVIGRFMVLEKTKDFEFLYGKDASGKNVMEIKNLISKLEKKQLIIHYLHKAFWKEFIQNDHIDVGKVENINRQITSLTISCLNSYNALNQSYPSDKTVIRSHAKFIEECMFQPEVANEMFQEAQQIEEEETVNARKFLQKNKTNKIVPTMSTLIIDHSTDMMKQPTSMEQDDEIENERFEGVENTESTTKKVDLLFRSSLAYSMKNQVQLTTFIVFSILSILLLVCGMVLSIVISLNVSGDIYLSKDICMPAAVPLGLTRRVREKQARMALFPDDSSWQANHVSKLRNFFKTLHTLQDLSSSNEISSSVRADYVKNTRLYRQPLLIYSDTNANVWKNYSIDRNISVSDITTSLINNCEVMVDYTNDQYNHTSDNMNFMYLYLNRINFSLGYENFCNEFLVRNQEKSVMYRNSFLIYYATSTTLYVMCALLMILATNYFLSSLKDAITLIDKRIPKDKIGKIYQNLNSKINDDMQIGNSGLLTTLSKPNNLIAILVISIILVTVGCVSLFFVETTINSQFSANAIQNIQSSVIIIMTSQRIGLRLQEIFIYGISDISSSLPLKKSTLTTPTELKFFHEDHKNLVTLINTKWNGLLYGTEDNGFQKLTGVYQQIDNIIGGLDDCNQTALTNGTSCETLADLIAYVVNSGTLFNEDVYYNPSKYTGAQAFTWSQQLFDKIDHLGYSLTHFIETYSNYAKNPSLAITISFFIFGIVALTILVYITFNSMRSFWDEYKQYRTMLNYFPSDLLDDEVLKKFILHKELPSKLQFKKGKSSVTSGSEITDMMHHSIDGTVMCNEKGEICLFNPVVESFFGHKSGDVVGLNILSLFSEPYHGPIKKLMNQLVDKSITKGESQDAECVRKNQSYFPARVNIFSSHSKIIFIIRDITAEKKQNILLEEEKKKSESLLRNILPEEVAKRLKSGETFIADNFQDITCFFSDMVGFTAISSTMTATDLVKMLNTIVNGFDDLTDLYKLEKIKTIGDAYFCIGGISVGHTSSDHPEKVLKFAIDVFTVVKNYNENNFDRQINIRVGLNTGGAVAGVIGKRKFAFDLWGDAINTASRMESTSETGRIQVSRTTYERVYDLGYTFEEREQNVKGKGLMKCYLLDKSHHSDPIVKDNFTSDFSNTENDDQIEYK